MPVKAKIRFDYKAEAGQKRRLFWRRIDLREIARENRDRQVDLLKNLPFQGLSVTDLKVDYDPYLVPASENSPEAAYAPVELVVEADSIIDLMPLTLKEEFRKIKVFEPEEIWLSNAEVERFIFKMNQEYWAEIQ
ncbi:MAG: hypothetical protein K6U80_11480 [Firmicutes bacterium]|nr:hypothetical protein [Bacillota bacterium]